MAQLEAFGNRVKFLTNLYNRYRELISDCKHQRLLEFKTTKGEFPLWPEMSFENKKKMAEKFNSALIGYRDVWHPISSQKPYQMSNAFPFSEKLSETTLWLPSSFLLQDNQIEFIAKTVKCEIC